MKEKEAIDWKEGFQQALIGQGKTSSKKGLEGGSLSCYHMNMNMNLNLDLVGFCLCGRKKTYGLKKSFLQEGNVRLRRRGKC
jgi:hypothetical protein